MKKNKPEKSGRKIGLFRLAQIAGGKKGLLLASMSLSVLATLAQFVPVVAVYLILEELAAHASNPGAADREALYTLGFITLGSVGVFGVLLYTSMMLSHIAAFNILYEIRVAVAEKLPRFPMGYFTQRSSGEIKKVMTDDVERIELFVAHHIPDITSAFAFPLIMIGFLFYMDWRLALAATAPLPLAVLVQLKMASSGELYRQYHDALERMNAAVVEYVRGMPVVKVFGASADSFRGLRGAVFDFRDFSRKVCRDYATVYPGFLTVISSSLVFIIPVAVFLLSRIEPYEAFLPTVLLFLVVGGGMYFPFFKLMFIGSYLKQISVGVERIDAILERDEMPERDTGARPADGSLEFDNVSFAYEETEVLKRVSFKASPGTVTALVGPSGAGKTTVGLLAARFWDVDAGAVRLGGVDIRAMKTEPLMDHISFVFQDGFLFFDTLEENIRMGNRTAGPEAVRQAAKAARCHEFIEKLPKGYATLVGEGGTYLSGGEQQRIAIARAILKDSPVVILDEATAFADPENEGKILEALARLIRDKTVIVIAHRLSTITRADRILVLDEGRIVQRGTHQELASREGLYRSMWETYTRSRQWTLGKTGRTMT